MIYVERKRDERLGFGGGGGGGGGGGMDDSELEEGEAACDYYYHGGDDDDDDDDDENIDPDVDLSYLDDKVQDVLGHFQKDFEGGVSAENLGAKFGGYGSFLPTYQRSPSVWSHPKSPQKVQSTSKSPSFPSESTCQNSAVLSSVTPLVKDGIASTSAAPSVSGVPFMEKPSKRDLHPSGTSSTVEFAAKHEPAKTAIYPSNPKSLKVRIKMGSDNVSRKTTAIFNDLGLDSPFSSPEDRPVESGGFPPKCRSSPDKSPTSILRIMTSSPVSGGLLSPLPDSLLNLMEAERPPRDDKSSVVFKGGQDGSSIFMQEPLGQGKVFGGKKKKSLDNRGRSVEVNTRVVKDGSDDSVLLKKEVDIEASEGMELVSNTLKLPFLNDMNYKLVNSAKDVGRRSDVPSVPKKERFLPSDFVKEEILDSLPGQGVKRLEKRKKGTSSEGRVWVGRNENIDQDFQSFPRKDGKSRRNKSYDPINSEVDGSKARMDFNAASTEPPRDKVNLKATAVEQNGVKPAYSDEQILNGGRKKSKGSKSSRKPTTEMPAETLTVVSSAAPKDKRKSSSDSSSKNKLDDSILRQESGKIKDSHRDSCTNVKMEELRNSWEMLSKERSKNHKLVPTGNETHQFADKSRERPISKKNNDKQVPSGAHPKADLIVAPTTETGPASDAATAAPVIIEEWVACDKCEKWRLLPYGRNPDNLPKKWVCSMLDWLPGMNHCNVSEEETTKALQALYIAVPESQSTQPFQPNGVASGLILPEVQHDGYAHQDPNLQAVPSGGKKKHGLKETPVHLSNSTKKNQQSSTKSRRLNDVNHSPFQSNLANRVGVEQVCKSSDSAVEKHRHKQKEKQNRVPDGGNANYSKLKIKREADQDVYRASKKTKMEGLSNTEAERNSDTSGTMGKNVINGLSGTVVGKDVRNCVEYSSSMDPTCDARETLPVSVKKPKDLVKITLDKRVMDIGKVDNKDIATKKRKVKEWQESQIYSVDTLADPAHVGANAVSFKEETSESELKMGKKARVSKSEGKESRKSKGSDTGDTSGRATRIHISRSRDLVADGMENNRGYFDNDQRIGQNRGGNIVSQRMLDSVDSVRRDLGYLQPSLAATSSSSKVSGSHRSKGNFQEAKGSPVESVSSSPFRLANPDKGPSTRRISMGKGDASNIFTVMGSPKRGSDGEREGGSDRAGTMRKAKSTSAVKHGSLQSSVFDYSDRDATHTSWGKPTHDEPSRDQFETPHLVNDCADALNPCNEDGKLGGVQHNRDVERVNNIHRGSNGSLSLKFGKGFSSQSKEKQGNFSSDLDKGEVKVSNAFIEQDGSCLTKNFKNEAEIESQDIEQCRKEQKDGMLNSEEKFGIKSGKDNNRYLGKKELVGNCSSEGRIANQSKFGGDSGSDAKSVGNCSREGKSNLQEDLLQDHTWQRSLHQSISDRPDQLEAASGRGKLKLVSHTEDKQETLKRSPLPTPISHKGSVSDLLQVDSSSAGGGDLPKVTKLPRKPDNKAGAYHSSLGHSTSNGLVGDLNGPSPVRKESSSQAGNNALKEAKDLKHSADRLKNSGADLDTTGLYFQAALKFLHGASLLEPSNIESVKHGESQSMNVYSTTASLCEFVAHEYERRKELAAASLAYKCMEVAYMRVVYLKHSSANKDRHELQATLHMVPPGESPSSSASDVDNLNNLGTLDKISLTKGVGSPHVGHIIPARNRSNFERMLNFTGDTTSAMDASRKSQNAFAAAASNLERAQYECVSKVLGCNFCDLQGLLRLARLAMEALSR